jgi:hypothetical protein
MKRKKILNITTTIEINRRNPVAKAVTRIVPKTVHSKKLYSRKTKHKKETIHG